jgi:flagellar motility protein MotE (MotC chaperone)
MSRLELRTLAMIFLLVIVAGCNPGAKEPKERSIKDVENAITVITDRREAEKRVISDQLWQIESLEENIQRSNTDGMKAKIRKDISIKRLAVDKAEKNIANQTDILRQLESTRDSLQAM